MEQVSQLLRWSAPISKVTWGEEIVIFHHQTGDTHLFYGFAKQIVDFCLSREVFCLASLMEWVRDTCPNRDDPDVFVQSIIDELMRKQLIDNLLP